MINVFQWCEKVEQLFNLSACFTCCSQLTWRHSLQTVTRNVSDPTCNFYIKVTRTCSSDFSSTWRAAMLCFCASVFNKHTETNSTPSCQSWCDDKVEDPESLSLLYLSAPLISLSVSQHFLSVWDRRRPHGLMGNPMFAPGQSDWLYLTSPAWEHCVPPLVCMCVCVCVCVQSFQNKTLKDDVQFFDDVSDEFTYKTTIRGHQFIQMSGSQPSCL